MPGVIASRTSLFCPAELFSDRSREGDMELFVPLKNDDPRPLYEQIYQYIKDEIRNGGLKAGNQLPSSRELAENLGVSRKTSQSAYEQLVAEGYLEVLPRKGHFVSQLEQTGFPEKGHAKPDFRKETVSAIENEKTYQVDFSPRGIDLNDFPFSTWRKISREALQEEEKDMFLKGDPMGDMSLRAAIRDYLHHARGVNCEAEQILIGAGSEYLLMLLSRLIGSRSRIAMENPTYNQAYRVLSSMGHRICPVDVDQSGIMIPALRETGADAAYVMPSHQFPTGVVMQVKRRQELLLWAQEREERYLIEDDYDSEFRYKGKPVPALQGMDQSGRVVYMGTFSKSIAPAIRVGYMVLPEKLLERYEQGFRFYSSTVSRLDQKILSEFISGGYFERHLNRMREKYKRKHDLLLSLLKPLETKFEISGEYAGLHILLTARGGQTEEELTALAEETGVRVYGLSGFYIGKIIEHAGGTVVLGYGGLREEELRTGAGLLIRAFRGL